MLSMMFHYSRCHSRDEIKAEDHMYGMIDIQPKKRNVRHKWIGFPNVMDQSTDNAKPAAGIVYRYRQCTKN